jgi:hypothetical protein
MCFHTTTAFHIFVLSEYPYLSVRFFNPPSCRDTLVARSFPLKWQILISVK